MSNSTVCTLYSKLCHLGFPYWSAVSEEDLYFGAPYLYTAFIRFILYAHRDALLFFTRKHSWFLIESSDVRLISVIFRLLKEEGHCSAGITLFQFEQRKFATAKANICLLLLNILKKAQSEHCVQRQTRVLTTRFSQDPYETDSKDFIDLKRKIQQRANDLNTLSRA